MTRTPEQWLKEKLSERRVLQVSMAAAYPELTWNQVQEWKRKLRLAERRIRYWRSKLRQMTTR
jgi:hypothetical protein